MVWIQFVASSALLVVAAMKLAEYGDIIAIRTKLGGLFIGTLLMAGATSLPEFLTTINSINQNVINLAAGNLFGSNMFNMVTLAILDLSFRQHRILRRSALKHALSGSLAALLAAMTIFFILADINLQIGWVGLDSILLMGIYLGSIYLIQMGNPFATTGEFVEGQEHIPSLRKALIGFGLATLVLILVTPWLVSSSTVIAEITGLGTGFIGTVLVALVTSLPELITTIAAIRLGAIDLAVGNLFGSNLFNIFALGASDLFYLKGRFLDAIDPGFLIVGLLGLILTLFGLIGNIARLERRIWFLEIDALILIIVYLGGMWLLYSRGLGI
ncbi:MAG: sodium:calcium antiporter [Anaerolineae bacterium]|nr:sodium:calcium antiporter [Anaerolineae bacterium]